MQAVRDNTVIGQAQRFIAFPVIFLIIQDPSYFVLLNVAFPPPGPSPGDRFCIRIDHDLAVDPVIVFILRWFYTLQSKITHFPDLSVHLINSRWFLCPGTV